MSFKFKNINRVMGFLRQTVPSFRTSVYTPYEGPNPTDLYIGKLGVYDRKLEGKHSLFYCYFDKYKTGWNNYVKSMFSSWIEAI